MTVTRLRYVRNRRLYSDEATQHASPREMEVAAGIARGLTNRQIAAELVIALGTTERHVANILARLGMQSRPQIAAWAAARGIADGMRSALPRVEADYAI